MCGGCGVGSRCAMGASHYEQNSGDARAAMRVCQESDRRIAGMLDTRPAGTALNLLLSATLPHASHSANWRRIVWKPILPAAVRMRGGMSER